MTYYHQHAPKDDECQTCPECNEKHATLKTEVNSEIEKFCNRCMANCLAERYSSELMATNCIKRAFERLE